MVEYQLRTDGSAAWQQYGQIIGPQATTVLPLYFYGYSSNHHVDLTCTELQKEQRDGVENNETPEIHIQYTTPWRIDFDLDDEYLCEICGGENVLFYNSLRSISGRLNVGWAGGVDSPKVSYDGRELTWGVFTAYRYLDAVEQLEQIACSFGPLTKPQFDMLSWLQSKAQTGLAAYQENLIQEKFTKYCADLIHELEQRRNGPNWERIKGDWEDEYAFLPRRAARGGRSTVRTPLETQVAALDESLTATQQAPYSVKLEDISKLSGLIGVSVPRVHREAAFIIYGKQVGDMWEGVIPVEVRRSLCILNANLNLQDPPY